MRGVCVFCDYAGPSPVLATFEDDAVFVIEPIKPVAHGHLLVIPRHHVPSATAFDTAIDYEAIQATFSAACSVARDVRREDGCDVNIITSAGPAATQSVNHLHVHVVPRRIGDGLPLPWSRFARLARGRT